LTFTAAHHTAFHVRDLDRSLAFYRGHFCCEVIWQRLNEDEYVRRIVGYPSASLNQAMLMLPGGQHRLELIEYRGVARAPVDTSPPNPGTAHICFLVDGLRAAYAELVEAGVDSVSEPVLVTAGANRGHLAVYMIDPDGFRIELLSVEAEEAAA
jgi:catechol 2,3-dioxygenase-like lactoylglutathione lyase family enzyme